MSTEADKSAELEELRPSKSQRKRESLALQDLGERLVNLPAGQLARVPIEGELADALAQARQMGRDSGRRRQLRFIGKLLRDMDVTPIQEAVAAIDGAHNAASAHHHRLEALCEALVTGDQQALGDLLDEHPEADRQHLRQLMRNAAREREQQRPPRARRELFRYLRTLLSEDA